MICLHIQMLSMLGVKEKTWKQTTLWLIKIEILQHKASFLTCIQIYPFKENMLKYDFMKHRHRLLFLELHQLTSDTPYIPQMCKVCRSLYHSRARIVAASRHLHIYTESANPIGAVLSCGCFFFGNITYVSLWILVKVMKL